MFKTIKKGIFIVLKDRVSYMTTLIIYPIKVLKI